MKNNKLLPITLLSVLALVGCGPRYVPPTYEDKDYSYLLGKFEGLKGSLEIEKDFALIKEGELERKLFPTSIKKETVTWGDATETYSDEVLAVYYGHERNNGDYKITLSSSLVKQVVFQKLNGKKYETQAIYVPEAPQFSGSYNLYGELDSKNNVYGFGNELNLTKSDLYPGYDVNAFYAYGDSFLEAPWLLVPGFYLFAEDQVAIAADTYDLTDGQFFETPYICYNENLVTVYEDELYLFAYADPTIFLGDLVDEQGNTYEGSYTSTVDEETQEVSYQYYFNNVEYDLEVRRSVDGLSYKLSAEGQSDIVFTAGYNNYTFKIGSERHRYANKLSALQPKWYSYANYSNGDFTKKITYYWDFDWDTWEDFLVLQYNGIDADQTSIKYVADGDGRAVLNFKAGEHDVSYKRITEYIGEIGVGSVYESAFNVQHYQYVYANIDLRNYPINLSVETDSDFKVSYNEGTPVQGCLVYIDSLDTVGLEFNGKTLLAFSSEDGYYFLADDLESLEGKPLLSNSLFEDLEGTYTSNGTNSLEFENGELTIDGTKANYEVVYSTAFGGFDVLFLTNNSTIIYRPDFKGVINKYSLSGSRIVFEASYIGNEVFNSFKGNYVTYNEKYSTDEHIKFTNDNKLLMDTDNGSGLTRDVEYGYAFSVEDSSYIINAMVQTDAGLVSVPFYKTDFALVFSYLGNNTIYLEEALYDLQGIYGDGSANAIMVYQNQVFVNVAAKEGNYSSKQNIVSISSVPSNGGRKDVITTEEYVIEAVYSSDALTSLSFYNISEGETSRVNLSVDSNNEALLTSKYHLEEGTTTVTTYDAELSSSFGNGKINVEVIYKLNGVKAMAPTAINGVMYHDGHLTIKINQAMTPFYLYMDGDTPVMEKGQSSLPPLPPAPPAPSAI